MIDVKSGTCLLVCLNCKHRVAISDCLGVCTLYNPNYDRRNNVCFDFERDNIKSSGDGSKGDI